MKLRNLIVCTGVLVAGCGGGGGSQGIGADGNISTSENHSLKTQVTYSDTTTNDEDTPDLNGHMKLKRVISMNLDYANNDGLTSFTKDLSLKYGTGLPVIFKTTQTPSCGAGGAVAIKSKLFKVNHFQQPDAQEEEVQDLANGDSVVLKSGTYYFIRNNIGFSGQCTALNSQIQIELHY